MDNKKIRITTHSFEKIKVTKQNISSRISIKDLSTTNADDSSTGTVVPELIEENMSEFEEQAVTTDTKNLPLPRS